MKSITKRLSRASAPKQVACAISIAMMMAAAPAYADPTIGFGLSVSYGPQSIDTGLGVRIFSDNEDDSNVATIGLDYMLVSQSWRATIGAARLYDETYFGLDLGFDGTFDFGVSAGLLREETEQVFAQQTGIVPVTPDQQPR